MDSRWMLRLLVALVALTQAGTQRTYRRTCDCEYMVDGRCAYTLLLPGNNGEKQVCPSSEDTRYKAEEVNDHLMQLRKNMSSLSEWSGEQAKLLSQLQGLVLSQQQTIQGLSSSQGTPPTTPADGNTKSASCSVCDALAVDVNGQKAALEALEMEVRQQVTSMAEVEARVKTIEAYSSILQVAGEQQKQQQNLTQQLMNHIMMLQQNITSLHINYFMCSQKGLVVSGPVRSIPDDMITASSTFNPGHAATRGRVFTTKNGTAMGAWCASNVSTHGGQGEPNEEEEWLQFDLGKSKAIFGIVTRGRSDYTQWVTKYKVKYTENDPALTDTKWMTYLDVLGLEQMFEGNTDQDTAKVNMLWQPIRAQYVRIIPTASSSDSNKCMRADLIGCMDEP